MFSGIRYILGYTDDSADPNEGGSSNSNESAPATVLEQTLNAATTKFTEQLLPQQASIEELQSSSHQLLPSIKEQHEENESKKSQSLDLGIEAIELETNEKAANADYDDSFEADSWELLDLVEKVEEQGVALGNKDVSAQREEENSPHGITKSPSGILKSASVSTSDSVSQQSRQKPKVSFETPNLVKGNQEIEQIKPKEASSSSKKEKSNKNKRDSTAHNGNCKRADQTAQPVNPKSEKLVNVSSECKSDKKKQLNEENPSLVFGAKEAEANASKSSMVKSSPCEASVLNYAKALSAKPGVELKKPVNGDERKWVSEYPLNPPLKRNLAGSSGEDETEPDGDIADWDESESLSDGRISDMECDYTGARDYILRPKKSNKRNRTQSGSSIRVRTEQVGRGSAVKHTASEGTSVRSEISSCKSTNSKVSSVREVSASMKNSRSKKKKLIMATASKVNSSDFLKPQAIAKKQKTSQSDKISALVASSNDSSDIAEMDESWYVTPPPCFTGANKSRSQDKVEQPKAREAARENALIEYPSIYIASSSTSTDNIITSRETNPPKDVVSKKVPKKGAATRASPLSVADNFEDDAAWKSDDEEAFEDDQFVCSKPIPKVVIEDESKFAAIPREPVDTVTKQVAIKKKKASSKKINDSTEKTKAKAPALGKPVEKKAWKNKFIVDDWDLDEQEGVDSDFDSMFEPVMPKKAKAKKQKQVKLAKTSSANKVSSLDMSTDSDEMSRDTIEVVIESHLESSNSVELISIRSLSMENSLTDENAPNLFKEEMQISDKASDKQENRRQPVPVRPIEPERRPGWQLKRQRSKRRPLANSIVLNKQQSSGGKSSKSTSSGGKTDPSLGSDSSSRSTPTFIDRIGSTIVANLTNLTNGLVSSGALNSCSPVGHSAQLVEGAEKMQQAVASKSGMQSASNPEVRKQLSKGSLKRQNICAQKVNIQRRPDRRLKMFATPNGCSINRKVHASIH